MIEQAQASDAVSCAALISGWGAQTPWMPNNGCGRENSDILGVMIARDAVFVVRRKGVVVGFLARDANRIQALYVHAFFQGAGIGSALLNHARGCADWLSLWVHVANIRAQHFYAAQGFCEVERSDGANNDEGLPDIRLEWRQHHG